VGTYSPFGPVDRGGGGLRDMPPCLPEGGGPLFDHPVKGGRKKSQNSLRLVTSDRAGKCSPDSTTTRRGKTPNNLFEREKAVERLCNPPQTGSERKSTIFGRPEKGKKSLDRVHLPNKKKVHGKDPLSNPRGN